LNRPALENEAYRQRKAKMNTFNKSAVTKTMKTLLERGECIDPATGEINYTGLAENAAVEHDCDFWLDDPDHEIWDLAIEVGDRFISQLP
jgi:hypothetical protein